MFHKGEFMHVYHIYSPDGADSPFTMRDTQKVESSFKISIDI